MKLSRARAGLMLALVLLLGASLISAGYAQSLQGKYVEYHLSIESPFKSTAGTLQQDVVEDYGNGTALIRYSGNFNSTKFVIEKAVNSSHIRFPYLPAFPSIFFSTVIGSLNVTLVSELVGSETVTFNGSDWIVSVTNFSLLVSPMNASGAHQASLDGTLKTFMSGLVYSLAANGGVDSAEGALTLSAQLTATNLDPDVQISNSSLKLSEIFGVELPQAWGAFNIVATEAADDSQETTEDITTSLISASLLGVAGFASVVYLRKKRNDRKETSDDTEEEKPPHWVH